MKLGNIPGKIVKRISKINNPKFPDMITKYPDIKSGFFNPEKPPHNIRKTSGESSIKMTFYWSQQRLFVRKIQYFPDPET